MWTNHGMSLCHMSSDVYVWNPEAVTDSGGGGHEGSY